MAIEQKLFGTTAEGREVYAFTFRDERSRSVTMLNYGCVIKDTVVLDREGNPVDISLGYDTLEEYEADTCAFGALMGRVAGRIETASFELNGMKYILPKNQGNTCLHGGIKGFNKKVYDFAVDGDTLIFTRVSPDGEEGFPGNLRFTQKTTFQDGRLRLEFIYESDADTIASFTNHNYFNLDGAGSGDIADTMVKINADYFCVANLDQVAQAPPVPVEGTVFDFREFKRLGDDIDKDDEQLVLSGGGFDHFWQDNGAQPIAAAYSPKSGVKLEAATDMPGVLMYTGNVLQSPSGGAVAGRNGQHYARHGAFCFECGYFPNAINEPRFPSVVVKAGETKCHFMEFRFDVMS